MRHHSSPKRSSQHKDRTNDAFEHRRCWRRSGGSSAEARAGCPLAILAAARARKKQPEQGQIPHTSQVRVPRATCEHSSSLRLLRKSAQSRFTTAVGMLCAALLRLLAAGAIFFRALSSQWHCRFLQTELCSLNGTLLRAILARFLSPQRVVSRGACARNPRCLI